jgi:hypothetical protein
MAVAKGKAEYIEALDARENFRMGGDDSNQ